MEMKLQLRAGLSSLPTPKNDFEIVLPEEVRVTCFHVHILYTYYYVLMYILAYVCIANHTYPIRHTYHTLQGINNRA